MPTRNELDQILKAYASEPDPIYPGAFRWPGVTHLDKAFIATDLGPRAKRHLKKGSHFCVVGYDCPNLIKKDYLKWEEFLASSCKKGSSFTYFLGKRDFSKKEIELLVQRFQEIAEQSQAHRGQIRVFVRSRRGGPLAESYANQWKRFHFAIFENPRQLWIETNHPEGETRAYDCYYLPPKIAKDEPLLNVYKNRFDMVVEECSSLAFES
jgi:hypothetical protein